MDYIITLILLFIGFMFGNLVLKQSPKNYDLTLLILAVFFLVLGSKTEVFRINDFKGMLSNLVPPFLFGVLIRRFIYRRFSKVHKD